VPSEGLQEDRQASILNDNEKQHKFVFYVCDEHFAVLRLSDLRYIARHHGA